MRWVLVPMAALAAACSLPERDNDYDPTNAPSVHGRVIDYGVGGNCAALTTTGTYTVVATGSRGHCLAIDARETSDPQGTPLGDLAFEFALLATGGDVSIASSGPFGPLDENVRNALPVGGIAYFRVRATDPTGASGSAVLPFVALNAAPVAAAVPARREVPLHGFPWLGVDAPVTVRFSSAASFDPDGESLTATWSLDGVTTVAPFLDVEVETDRPLRAVTKLVVRDASETSEPAFGTVTVAPPKTWVLAGRGDYLFQRLDLESSAIALSPAPPSGVFVAFLAPGEPDALVITQPGGFEFFVGEYPTVPPLVATLESRPWMETPYGYPALAFDRATRTLWEAGNTGTYLAPNARIATLIISTQGGLSYTDGIQVDVPGYQVQLAAVDAGGNFWTFAKVPSGGGTPPRLIAVRKNDLSLSTLDLEFGMADIGFISPRPGTNEVWVRSLSYIDGRILRFQGLPGDGYSVVDGPAFGFGLLWADSQRFWIHTEDGLALVDADVLAAGLPFDTAVVRNFPEVLSAQTMNVDPETGDVWIRESIQPMTLYRASIDGSLDSHPIDAGSFLQAIDPAGIPLLAESNGFENLLRRTNTPLAANGASASRVIPFGFEGHLDPLTGGIWVVRQTPRQLYRIGPDGDLLQVVDVPGIASLRMSHDGRRAWGFSYEPNGALAGAVVLSFDESGFVEMRNVLDAAAAAELAYRSRVQLVPTRSSSAWGVRYDTGAGRYVVESVSDTGTRTDVYSLPVGEAFTFFSESTWGDAWSDDSLCLVNAVYPVPDQANAVHVRRVTAAGTADLGVVGINSNGTRPDVFVSTTEEAGVPLCWVAATENGTPRGLTVFAVNQAGAVVHRIDLADVVGTSMHAVDRDRVMFGTIVPAIGAVRSTLHVVDFLPGSVTGTSGHLTFTADGEGQGPLLLGR